MINYNITVSVDDDITADWLDWMQKEHIPDVMSSGVFIKAHLGKLISPNDSHNTFAITYSCSTIKDLHFYQLHFATNLQKKHDTRYGDKVLAFRTIMEIIQDF